jgi:hypothetical protein
MERYGGEQKKTKKRAELIDTVFIHSTLELKWP